MVGYSSKDEHFLIILSISHNFHGVVANQTEHRRGWNILHLEPRLLIEEEQEHVIEEGNVLYSAELIVAASNHDQGLVAGQVAHLVSNSAAWWNSLLLDLRPLGGSDLAVNQGGLEVLQLV